MVYMEYVKEKLQYVGIPYYSDVSITADFGTGLELGFQRPFVTDCSIFIRKGELGKWRAESKLLPFYGAVSFNNRSPWIGFDGFAPADGGSWTTSAVAKVLLPRMLPEKFVLDLTVRGIFGPNADDPIIVQAGNQRQSLRIQGQGVYTVHFAHVKDADEIAIVLPHPASPKSLGMSEDERLLGVALSSLIVRRE
ncbi:hypothetical protein PBS_02030 [Paraburkholderia sp. 2C]